MSVTESGFKGGVHAAAASVVAAMLAYNVLRWSTTQERRNAVNIAIYTPLLIFEWCQARYHWTHP